MNTDTQATRCPQPCNECTAQQRINQAIAQTPLGASIPASIARLIAATIHRGPDTALGRFAATGVLDAHAAAQELHSDSARELPPDWWLALDLYLQQAHRARTAAEGGDRE